MNSGAPGGRYQISLGIHQQESGGVSGLGGHTANIRGMWKGDGKRGRGEVAREMVATGGCGTTSEYHSKRYLWSSVAAAATVIWQVWWGQGRGGRVGLWWWQVREGRVTVFFCCVWTETGDARVGGWSCVESGRKNTAGEAWHCMAGGESWEGPISVHNNKRRSLGPEWSMSEVGTPPPHN